MSGEYDPVRRRLVVGGAAAAGLALAGGALGRGERIAEAAGEILSSGREFSKREVFAALAIALGVESKVSGQPGAFECPVGTKEWQALKDWAEMFSRKNRLFTARASLRELGLVKEITLYGTDVPCGNIETLWIPYVLRDQGAESLPVNWMRNMQTVYDRYVLPFNWRELRGQFIETLRIMQPVMGRVAVEDLRGLADIDRVFEDGYRQLGLLAPQPGVRRVYHFFLVTGRGVVPPINFDVAVPNFAAGRMGTFNDASLRAQDDQKPFATIIHEGFHAAEEAPHASEDSRVNGGNSHFREDSKNILAAGRYVDDWENLLVMQKEFIDPQKRMVNVDPATPVPSMPTGVAPFTVRGRTLIPAVSH